VWVDYATWKEVPKEDKTTPAYLRWRNQILDAQALWAHEHAERDVFVTSDQRLLRLNGHIDFPDMLVKTPEEAIKLL
jgi:hypothetical protein